LGDGLQLVELETDTEIENMSKAAAEVKDVQQANTVKAKLLDDD
jgi:hypothetical protein